MNADTQMNPENELFYRLMRVDFKPLRSKLKDLEISDDKIESIIRFLRADYVSSHLVETLNGETKQNTLE